MDDEDKLLAEMLEEYKVQLLAEANRLAECINSAGGAKWASLGGAASAVGDISVIGNTMTTTVNVDDVIRPSIFAKWTGGYGNIFWLLNDGYSVKQPVWFRDIPNFGQRKGAHFFESAIGSFLASNSLGIVLDWSKPTNYYG